MDRLEYLEQKLLEVDLEYSITGLFKYKMIGKAIQEEINDLVSKDTNAKQDINTV